MKRSFMYHWFFFIAILTCALPAQGKKLTKARDLPTKTELFVKADDYCTTQVEDLCENKFCLAYCDQTYKDDKWRQKECEGQCNPDQLCRTAGEATILDNPLTIQIRSMYTACLHEMRQKFDPRNPPPPNPSDSLDDDPMDVEEDTGAPATPATNTPNKKKWSRVISDAWKKSGIKLPHEVPTEPDYEDE